LEQTGQGERRRSKTDWVGTVLLLFAVAALIVLNLLKSGILGGAEALIPGFQVLYPLAYASSALSMAAFAALLLLPGRRIAAFRISSGLAALSALCSVSYAVGWWIFDPELMFWQDYAGIALQALACALTVALTVRRKKGPLRLLVLASLCVTAGTLIFLLPPLMEPAASVLTRALALASPMALLAVSGLFTEESVPSGQEG